MEETSVATNMTTTPMTAMTTAMTTTATSVVETIKHCLRTTNLEGVGRMFSRYRSQKADDLLKTLERLRPLPPEVVASTAVEDVDAKIVIEHVPPVKMRVRSHCAIERILHHIKDAYIDGKFDDDALESWLDGRKFSFCMTYCFSHEGDRLIVKLYVSRTELAPVWGDPKMIKGARKSKKLAEMLTPMEQDEVELVKAAFVRQCENTLRTYVSMVYNHSVASGVQPDYYGTGF